MRRRGIGGAVLALVVLLVASSAPVTTPDAASAVRANDPLRQLQYGLDRIDVEPAWARARGAGVVIAIVDTGVHLSHEDLAPKLVDGYDFIDENDVPQDHNGHGTHVAGIAAAATNNGLGVAGTAPDASIMPLRVLDAEGTGVESDVAEAIRFAVQRAEERGDALVVNLSLTDLRVQEAARRVEDAIRDAWFAGAVIVAAAGNEDLPYSDYPAAGPNVLSVGATDEDDERAPFSNRGALVSAPGHGIVSTFWDPAAPEDRGAYASGSGTSMAAAFVSGIAALLLSTGLSNEETVVRIIETADDLGTEVPNSDLGYGRVNAARALGVREAPAPGGSTAIRVPEGRFERIVPEPNGAPEVREDAPEDDVAAAEPVGAPGREAALVAALLAFLVASAATGLHRMQVRGPRKGDGGPPTSGPSAWQTR